ncbi:hypothetical protein [Nocardioides cynanchi]|nr:hypothetical protein [Nocardioides cynanchi]
MEWVVVGVVVVVVLLGLVVVRRRRLEAEEHARRVGPGSDGAPGDGERR